MTEHPQSPSPETILAHEPFIRALARRLVGDPGGADDVTQETLIAAWRGGPVERLRSWMATAARNNVRMAWRSESSRRRREESVSRSEPSVPSPEEISERQAIALCELARLAPRFVQGARVDALNCAIYFSPQYDKFFLCEI